MGVPKFFDLFLRENSHAKSTRASDAASLAIDGQSLFVHKTFLTFSIFQLGVRIRGVPIRMCVF